MIIGIGTLMFLCAKNQYKWATNYVLFARDKDTSDFEKLKNESSADFTDSKLNLLRN